MDEVIVVCEGDETEIAAAVRSVRPDAVVLRPGRPGSGNALATGLAAANCDIVVALSGDGSTDPAEIPRYVAALTAGADVAVGSRYREGGRDLTGGRFRRWLNLALIWLVNALLGTERTDPGFGYAAFWRDALDHLDLPDPAHARPAWGDGPEFGPILTLRPSARGMRVAEVGSVAYPRMSRPARTERPALHHWLRALAAEHRTRDDHPPYMPPPMARTDRRAPGTARTSDLPVPGTGGNPHDGVGATYDMHGEVSEPSWPHADRRRTGEPIWGPPHRRPSPVRDLWRAGDNPLPHTSPRPLANPASPTWRTGYPGRATGPDAKPRTAEDKRPDPAQARLIPPQPPAPREVGLRRRRLESYRQRPDLKVINGEGTGGGRTRSGRLRPVPRENLGG